MHRALQQWAGRGSKRPGWRSGEPRRSAAVVEGGFTLVEVMIVVAIVGVLAALSVTAIRGYIESARTSEAKQNVGQIARAANAAFERDAASSQLLNEGALSAVLSQHLCGTAVPVPDTVPTGAKYQPSGRPGEDFRSGDPRNGWQCLRFTVDQPILYQYSYAKGASPVAPDNPAACSSGPCYEAAARGDTNADGVMAKFAQTGHVHPSGNAIQLATYLYLENQFD